MTDTQTWLVQYAESGSESAFRELVARYVNLVYATALRLLEGDAALAEDVTQTVFIDLARLGRTLSRDVMLGGWLHRHTCFVARKALRGERRRQTRERQAGEMSIQPDHTEANLAQLMPVLDEAIDQLGTEDRSAILQRFFEQRDFRTIGQALGISDDTAQKRVTRALEKLRGLLEKRGVALSTGALATALVAETASAAPAALTASIAGTALASTAAGGTGLTSLKLMTLTKVKIFVIGALVVAGGAVPIWRWVRAADAHTHEGITQIDLSGTAGAVVTGSYVQDGRRIAWSNAVPCHIQAPRISTFELEKASTADTVVVSLRYDGETAHSMTRQVLEPGMRRLRGRVENGLITETMRPSR